MAKKESAVKAAGRFVANEMLGVDDVKNAVKHISKGEFVKAAKSVGAAALEAGTTVTGAGIGAKIGAKVGLKAGEELAKKEASKTAASTFSRYVDKTPEKVINPSSGSRTIKTKGAEVKVESKAGSTSTTPSSKSVTINKAGGSEAQLEHIKSMHNKQVANQASKAADSSYEASVSTSSLPSRGEKSGARKGAAIGLTAVAATKRVEAPSGTQANHAVTTGKNHTKTVK